MTFDDWLKNPAGKKSAVMTSRQMYRDMYTQKYNKVMLREGNKFEYKCYKNKLGNRFLIHIKVPSEIIPKFYYDVIISFTTNNPALYASPSLKGYDVQFYTNSPDFVYTHCHAYVKAKLFYTPLSKRMNKLSLTKTAVERNPHDQVSYVKSIVFAYFIMQSKSLFSKTVYTDTINDKDLLRNVRQADEVVAARQEAAIKLEKEKKRTKIENDRKADVDRHKKNPNAFTTSTGSVSTIKRTSTVATTGKTKATKRM